MYMLSLSKKIAVPFMLAAFLTVALFGFVAMSYGPDGRMQGGCPFSATGVALCPQDALVVALHHVGAYQSFLNVPLDSAAALISVLLLLAYLFVSAVQPLLFSPPARSDHLSHGPPLSARTRKITRWLALLELSPAFP
ncbi:MAG: hypothetical protein NUV90_00525 [Candidatus Parcubacteria bacterium]|nr:hypothetical protein [Candidatus Parcubacteria bacterium]